MSRSGNPRKVTFDSEIERGVVFSGDETFIFGSGAGLTWAYQQTIGGSRRLLFDGGRPFVPSSVTADERVLLFGTFGMDPPGGDIWAAIRTAGGHTVAPLIQGVGNQSDARLSPGGHRVAWVTDEGGRNEVFVGDMKIDAARGSVTVVGATRVSHGGGYAPRWRPDGRELLYLTPDGGVMAVGVDKGGYDAWQSAATVHPAEHVAAMGRRPGRRPFSLCGARCSTAALQSRAELAGGAAPLNAPAFRGI